MKIIGINGNPQESMGIIGINENHRNPQKTHENHRHPWESIEIHERPGQPDGSGQNIQCLSGQALDILASRPAPARVSSACPGRWPEPAGYPEYLVLVRTSTRYSGQDKHEIFYGNHGFARNPMNSIRILDFHGKLWIPRSQSNSVACFGISLIPKESLTITRNHENSLETNGNH